MKGKYFHYVLLFLKGLTEKVPSITADARREEVAQFRGPTSCEGLAATSKTQHEARGRSTAPTPWKWRLNFTLRRLAGVRQNRRLLVNEECAANRELRMVTSSL
ncbi:hypothetical protein L798_10540 [Zootermopsis nevadensis]|uniref:Uncharacterized protein n=1 Tax=Zootermopsis nevadensis TaxID=136037 RepID=A0A067R7V7_ZOONE|nr:hypothetical protein L798_10540 [Zootermopsis nevadensis]